MNVISDNFRMKLAVDILTEISMGACHTFTAASIHFCTSSKVLIPCWKNSGDNLQSERIPSMRTSPSERGSGKDRLALGRAAIRLVIPKRSISRRRRPAT